jgi:hypothetical protein
MVSKGRERDGEGKREQEGGEGGGREKAVIGSL